jgi:hypothetical protein
VPEAVKMSRKNSQSSAFDRIPSEKHNNMGGCTEKRRDDGFLLSCDYFTIRRQSRKADANRLSAWQEAGRRNLKMTCVRSEFENGSGNDDRTRSDPSDDDGYNVVIADNCQRVFVNGLKLLWTIENRDAVWSWVGGISKAFEPPEPSSSQQDAQRKLHEENQIDAEELLQDDISNLPSTNHKLHSPSHHAETSGTLSSPSDSAELVKNSSFPSIGMSAIHLVISVLKDPTWE